ncbi:MAG: hypothetical protein WD231_02870 [Candidatus Woykebacteria bacterium]
MVNRELLDKFKSLYKRKFDIDLSDEEATKMATDLMNLVRVLIKPLPRHDNNNIYFQGEK